jgi:hypothetical protein
MSSIADCQATIFVVPLAELGEVQLRFMREVGSSHLVLLMAVHNPDYGMLSVRRRAEVLNTIRAQLRDLGRDRVPVECVILGGRFGDSNPVVGEDTCKLDRAWKVVKRICVFVKAVSVSDTVPHAVLSPDLAHLQADLDYLQRVRERREEFTWLSNVLDLTLTLGVRREGMDWRFTVSNAESGRLELPLDTVRQALVGLSGAGLQNTAGALVPERVRAEVARELEGWMRKNRIGCTCAIDLTLQCLDHQTALSIQQSPIKVEVR